MTRTLRLTFAIVAAVALAGALLYTSFAGSAEAREPSQMHSAEAGRSYRLTGIVVKDSFTRDGETIRFRVRDRKGDASVPVSYTGEVPDPFREGREVIVTVEKTGEAFTGKPNTLITKCPSKFDDGKTGSGSQKMEWRDSQDRVVDGE
jgi:cytochrome c-type biogenesis protein CcmE